MAATVAQIAQLRRMIDERVGAETLTYTDDDLSDVIERYPLLDEHGQEPYEWNYATIPPTRSDRDAWIPTYDMAAAAAELWGEKAAYFSAEVDQSTGSASADNSQAYEQAARMARYWSSRRMPRVITLQGTRPTLNEEQRP